jgi:hypothetical protein
MDAATKASMLQKLRRQPEAGSGAAGQPPTPAAGAEQPAPDTSAERALDTSAGVLSVPAPAPARGVARVLCATTTGQIAIDVHLGWSPPAAARFLQLVDIGYYEVRRRPPFITHSHEYTPNLATTRLH